MGFIPRRAEGKAGEEDEREERRRRKVGLEGTEREELEGGLEAIELEEE